MRTRLSPRSFGGGELAPWLDGISSEVTAKGCRTLENFVVMKQGPITRRPGTFYVNEVKDSTDDHPVLVPVTIDDDNSYVLELGDAYVRFYKNHVQVSLAAAAYEVTTPWSIGDVTDLRWAYIPDEKAVYFTHPKYALRKLAYISGTNWTLDSPTLFAAQSFLASDSDGRVLLTTDFEKWTLASQPDKSNINFNAGHIFVAAAENSTNYSTDGQIWVQVVSTGVYNRYFSHEMATLEDGSVRMLVGSGMLHSIDNGLTWEILTNMGQSSGFNAMGYDPILGRLRWGGHHWGYSDDAGRVNISLAPPPDTALPTSWGVTCIKGYNDKWVMCGSTKLTSATSINQFSLVLSQSYSVFEVIETNNTLWISSVRQTSTFTHSLYVSTDTLNWSLALAEVYPANSRQQSIKWVRNKFIEMRGDIGKFHTSPDGIIWTSHTLPVHPHFQHNAWSTFNDDPSYEWFDVINHYPKLISFYEGRMIIGPTKNNPSTLWGSETNNHLHFYLGEFASDAWSYELSSDRNVDIQWIMGGMGGLVVGTRTGEGILLGSPDEGITPNAAQFKWQSTFGSDNIQPVRVHDYIIFTQRGGEIIRGYVPGAGAQAYKSPDLTAYADHIAEGGVHEFDHQDDPQTIVYAVRNDGTLLALTFEDNTVAWSRIVTDGDFESVAVIPTAGAEDEVWAVVKRTIGAATKRYIEYFDTLKVSSALAAHYVDCGYENAAAGSATVFANVMPQLAGESIDVLVNGNIVEHARTVSASGTFSIANTAATHIHAGLPYVSYAQTMRLETSSPWGSGMGLSKRNANLLVWVHDTIGGEFGPEVSITEAVAFSASSTLTTDLLEVNFPGTWDRDGYIWCIQRDPLPMTIVAVAPDIEVGDK